MAPKPRFGIGYLISCGRVYLHSYKFNAVDFYFVAEIYGPGVFYHRRKPFKLSRCVSSFTTEIMITFTWTFLHALLSYRLNTFLIYISAERLSSFAY